MKVVRNTSGAVDEHLRRLEREAINDPSLKDRVARLRCKVEGCLSHYIIGVKTYLNTMEMRSEITFLLQNGDHIDTFIRDVEIMRGELEPVRDRMAAAALNLAHCIRCGEPDGKEDVHLKDMAEFLL